MDSLLGDFLQADNEVDNLKHQIFRELLEIMKVEPQKVAGSLQLILISRHFERIADHATNIAEEVIYMVKGEDIRHPEAMQSE